VNASEKTHRLGTHRVVSPEATRQRLDPLLRVMGITRIANVTGLDHIGIPVVVVCRPNSRSLAVAQGKGHTLACAEVSGLMESIEFYHAEHIDSPLLLGSYDQLRFRRVLLDPESLPRSSEGRYHPTLKLHWIEGVDLQQQRECWVPHEMVHTDYTLPFPADSGCFPMTSNGLASGNHLYEAVAHGVAEVIERDAETLFRLLPQSERDLRRVDLSSVDCDVCLPLLNRLEAADVEIAVWDITSDVGVASFRAVIADRQLDPQRPLRPNSGSGSHPNRGIALSRALTEAAQSRLTVISGSRDDLPRERYDEAADLQRLVALRESAFRGVGHRHFHQAPNFESDNLEADVHFLKNRLASVGIEHLVVVDLTKPEFGIPVVRVLVPGLEQSRDVPGYRPGKRARQQLERLAA